MDFKVKCVGYVEPVKERYFTIGKVYDVIDGAIVRDDGFRYHTWSDPSCNPKYENSFKGLCNWFANWYKFELVTESKYKVGDKVKVRSDLNFDTTYGDMYFLRDMGKYRGKTVVIDRIFEEYYGIEGYREMFWTDEMFEGLAVENNKIVITHDGKTTTATLYREDGSKEVATAKCCPEDTFDFNVGAKLAMERLMKKVIPITVCGFKVGDRVNYNGVNGTIICISDDYEITEGCIGVEFDTATDINHNCGGISLAAGTTGTKNTSRWMFARELTMGEVPEPPKYFNGKVVCVNSGNVPGDLTVGKIYDFKDGCCVSDRGCQITTSPIKDCDELNYRFACTGVKFIPIVE